MTRRRRARRAPVGRRGAAREPAGAITESASERGVYHETSPRLTGGDVDADWRHAWDAGDEAVGGSTSTPDQDVVDELGEALGVAQAPDAEVQTSGEILAERDRHRWTLEREVTRAARVAEGDDEEDEP
jgi:uncharacterized protein DUF6335